MFCKRCRYNLKMIQSGSCPECGRAFDAGDAKTYRKSAGWPKGVRRCLQGMGVIFVFVLIALVVIEVRYQREMEAAKALEKVGAYLAWTDDAQHWALKFPFLSDRFQHVYTLELSNTNFPQLPPDLWKLTNLTRLYLYDNRFTALPPGIVKLTKLKHLSVHYNLLAELPPEIGNLKSLLELDLHHNQICRLPPELSDLVNLLVLDLSRNQLSTIGIEISMLPRLRALDLSGNPITDEDLEHLKALSSLRVLSLIGTKVTSHGVARLRLALPNCLIENDFDQPTP